MTKARVLRRLGDRGGRVGVNRGRSRPRFFVGRQPVYGDVERRIESERARIEAEYRQVLESSVLFEKRIRDRWREKCFQRTGESPSWRSASPPWSGASERRTLEHGLLFGGGDQAGVDSLAFGAEMVAVLVEELGPICARRVPVDEHGVGVSLHPFCDHLVVRILPGAGDRHVDEYDPIYAGECPHDPVELPFGEYRCYRGTITTPSCPEARRYLSVSVAA